MQAGSPLGPSMMPVANHSVAVYRRIATLFLLLTLAVVGLVLYVIFARATVVVLAAQEEVGADFIIDVSRKPVQGEVKGDALEVTDTLSQKFPSTSVVKVDAHAEGRVKITSTLFRAQTLVATTRLLTADDVLFRIKSTVVVPANGSVEVAAFADQPGPSGDVGNATFTIPGLNPETRTFFKVETVTPMEGGTREVRLVTSQDVASAGDVLRGKLSETLTAKLREMAKERGIEGDGEIVAVENISQLTDVPVGSEAPEFGLTVKVKATGVFYDQDGFNAEVKARLKERLAFDRELVSVQEDSVTKTVEKKDLIAGRANIRVSVKGSSAISASSPALDKEKLTGLSAEAAKKYLEGIEGVSSASVRTRPFWAGRMPNVAEHITIEVR